MNLIALGTAACSIADAFAQYPQYEIYKIDVDISGKRCYSIPEFKDVEEYENYSYPFLGNGSIQLPIRWFHFSWPRLEEKIGLIKIFLLT